MADRYVLQIDEFHLDTETIEDTFEKAIARYEYPYADGAETEDMGAKPRGFRIRCYFLGEQYDRHTEFVDHLKTREIIELIHPKHGILRGRVETVTVRHDDRTDAAEIDLTFVEDLLHRAGAGVVGMHSDVSGAVEESFVAGQQDLLTFFAGDVRQALGPEADAVLAAELDPDLSILDQINGVSPRARTYLKAVDAWIGAMAGELAEVTVPATSLLSVINYPSTVPGRVIGTMAHTVARYAALHFSLKIAPLRFIASVRAGLALFVDSAAGYGPTAGYNSTASGFARQAAIAAAQRLALETAEVYQADQANRQRLRRREQARNFDALGNYLRQEPAPETMTVGDLEETLAMVRADLQIAIDIGRADTVLGAGLKSMAMALLAHVNEVKIERDRLLSVRLDNPMPLHLVCLRHGLPYQYAERLMKVNRINHPNFCAGEVLVYGR